VIALGKASPEDGLDTPRLTVTVALSAGGERVIRVGRAELLDGNDVYRVRVSHVDATFAVQRSRLRPLLDAL
jgi:hypothetical protein